MALETMWITGNAIDKLRYKQRCSANVMQSRIHAKERPMKNKGMTIVVATLYVVTLFVMALIIEA